MKVLVTGGTGFVGSHSVRALLDASHQVRLAEDSIRNTVAWLKAAGQLRG